MALMKTISGIRGTIGGAPDSGLTPIDIVKFTAAFAQLLQNSDPTNKKIVIGRDGRMSGSMVTALVSNTLVGMGFNVIDLGLSTTPTVEMAVVWEDAIGGIIITASHNPKQWNALKLLNNKGEFISAELGKQLLEIADNNQFLFAEVDHLGSISYKNDLVKKHIDAILDLPLVNPKAIANRNFKIVVDGINSSGAIVIPELLKALGVNNVTVLSAEPHGNFEHNPEPLPENLTNLCQEVVSQQADLGISIDPDVDRLCFVNEDGTLFGEEYTLVAIADYVLQHTPGNTVSNLSSTKALREITEQKHNRQYQAAAVGEVNVVVKMKEINAVIGGEGNGGVIYPQLHYGRDAMVGIALFLSHLTNYKTSSELRNAYPKYVISKNKIDLNPSWENETLQLNIQKIFNEIKAKFSQHPIIDIDGVKIHIENDWVHIRASNTEPIMRIYSESDTSEKANALAQQVMEQINETAKSL
jgi:phosphomannomutase